MGLLDRFKLYDHHRDWVVTVIPQKDGTYSILGTKHLKHIKKDVDADGLGQFIQSHGLMKEWELGQLTLDDLL